MKNLMHLAKYFIIKPIKTTCKHDFKQIVNFLQNVMVYLSVKENGSVQVGDYIYLKETDIEGTIIEITPQKLKIKTWSESAITLNLSVLGRESIVNYQH